MNSKLENGKLTVFFSGRIDSANADIIEKELNSIKDSNEHNEIVIDMKKLEYISSAGLRIILRVRKSQPNAKIVNVSSDVYEVLEMTGFTEMMNVEKAYREFSIENCEVIGQGANGKVYRLDADTIIKVYYNPDSLPDIHRERELARKAFVLGIPTAIPYDVVKVGDGYGSVFELLNATSFAKLINKEPENIDKYVELYVDLLKKIHSTEVKKGDMPNMKEVVVNWAIFLKDYLPENQTLKLLSLVNAVPENNHMLHGDYHLKNVMMQNGEVLLIDMDTLCVGDPVFEFASVFLSYNGYCALDHNIVKEFMGIDYDTASYVLKKTFELYFDTDDEKVIENNLNKAKLIGYVRQMRRTIRRNGFDTEEGRAMIDFCAKEIGRLLEIVDTLTLGK